MRALRVTKRHKLLGLADPEWDTRRWLTGSWPFATGNAEAADTGSLLPPATRLSKSAYETCRECRPALILGPEGEARVSPARVPTAARLAYQ